MPASWAFVFEANSPSRVITGTVKDSNFEIPFKKLLAVLTLPLAACHSGVLTGTPAFLFASAIALRSAVNLSSSACASFISCSYWAFGFGLVTERAVVPRSKVIRSPGKPKPLWIRTFWSASKSLRAVSASFVRAKMPSMRDIKKSAASWISYGLNCAVFSSAFSTRWAPVRTRSSFWMSTILSLNDCQRTCLPSSNIFSARTRRVSITKRFCGARVSACHWRISGSAFAIWKASNWFLSSSSSFSFFCSFLIRSRRSFTSVGSVSTSSKFLPLLASMVSKIKLGLNLRPVSTP